VLTEEQYQKETRLEMEPGQGRQLTKRELRQAIKAQKKAQEVGTQSRSSWRRGRNARIREGRHTEVVYTPPAIEGPVTRESIARKSLDRRDDGSTAYYCEPGETRFQALTRLYAKMGIEYDPRTHDCTGAGPGIQNPSIVPPGS